ncbi:MAG: hypothetical protein JW882_13250 [Deltaproteobacteria bacterium]|nr:hypothetical protein [Deltaproteobacteria bacterium]
MTDGEINLQSHGWFPDDRAQQPCLYGLRKSNTNVLTMSGCDTFDAITGGRVPSTLFCKVYKEMNPQSK